MAGLQFLRTLTTRVMTVVMTTVIAFSIVLGFTANSLVTRWQANFALESLSALASARQHAIVAQVSRYLDVGTGFAAPDLGYDIEQLQAAEGAEAETMREAVLRRMRRELRSNELLRECTGGGPGEPDHHTGCHGARAVSRRGIALLPGGGSQAGHIHPPER